MGKILSFMVRDSMLPCVLYVVVSIMLSAKAANLIMKIAV